MIIARVNIHTLVSKRNYTRVCRMIFQWNLRMKIQLVSFLLPLPLPLLYKGSSKQFWQILGKIYNRKHIPSCSGIFVIAIFCGSSKPASIEEYLHDFIVELSHLMEVGLTFHGKHYTVDVVGFACDAPARAYVKCIKGPLDTLDVRNVSSMVSVLTES